MPTFYSYSFLDNVMAITGPGGAFPIAGSGTGAADEGITVIFADEKDTTTVGADGAFMHSLHAAQNGQCEVSLLKNSPVNQLLQVMYDLQSTSGAVWGQNILTLANTTSGDGYLMIGAAFQKFPDNAYQKDGNIMKWGFNVGNIRPKLGSGV